jgi:hypothetical protein
MVSWADSVNKKEGKTGADGEKPARAVTDGGRLNGTGAGEDNGIAKM